jgi:hypothetical protein
MQAVNYQPARSARSAMAGAVDAHQAVDGDGGIY